jgi:hypothetical protein
VSRESSREIHVIDKGAECPKRAKAKMPVETSHCNCSRSRHDSNMRRTVKEAAVKLLCKISSPGSRLRVIEDK